MLGCQSFFFSFQGLIVHFHHYIKPLWFLIENDCSYSHMFPSLYMEIYRTMAYSEGKQTSRALKTFRVQAFWSIVSGLARTMAQLPLQTDKPSSVQWQRKRRPENWALRNLLTPMSFLFSALLITATQSSTADGRKCWGSGDALVNTNCFFACYQGLLNHIIIIVVVLAG